MENKDENSKDNETRVDQIKHKVSTYTSSKVQGLKNETIGVLKDFSTKNGLIENSKKMHHLRVFALVFIVFTLLLTSVAATFTVFNGLSSGHNYKEFHYSASFNWGAIPFAIGSFLCSFFYLRQAYRNKKFVWIPALLIPVITLFFLKYVSNKLSWYGIGADVAQGCSNFAAILSFPPLLLELTATGKMQKAGNFIKSFFVYLKNKNVHTLRIVGIAIALTVIVLKIIDLIYISTSGPLFTKTLHLSLFVFPTLLASAIVYIVMAKKNASFAWICPVVFAVLNMIPGIVSLISRRPFAELLSYVAAALGILTIGFELSAKFFIKKKKNAPKEAEVSSP